MAGSIGRGTLPSNYEDFRSSVSMNLTLPTPTSQFLFAQWAMAGRLSLAAMDAGQNTVQQYVSMMGGGAPVAPDFARLVRVADTYPGFVNAVDQFGLGMGDTIKFQRDVYSIGGQTEADRQLVTDQTISTTGENVQTEEVPVTLHEFIGPYKSGGSAVNPYQIWKFDAKYRANKRRLTDIVTKHLVYDYTAWLDVVIRLRFQASTYITLSDPDFSDVTEYVAGGDSKFSAEQLLRARKTLSDREWPAFGDGRYVAIVPTSFNTDMLTDIEYRDMSKFHKDGRNQIFGYVGSLQDIDIYESSSTKQWAAASTVTGTGGGTVPASVTLEEGLLVGPGVVGFGTGLPPEARFADSTNYGTVLKVIWYAIHAFQTLDQRGCQRFIAQST